MDFKRIKQGLAQKQQARERVAAEAEELRRQLAVVSKATRAAAQRAEEEALFAVITPTPEATAKAEQAKATLRSADDQEQGLRDRLPILDRALGVLDAEIADLEGQLPSVANAEVAAALTARLDEIDAELAVVTGKLYARAKALGALHFEIAGVVVDRLQRPGMRQRVLDAAAQARAEITGGAK